MLHLRERQDGRLLLGGDKRVLQDWKEKRDSKSGFDGVLVQVNIYEEDFFKMSYDFVIKGVSIFFIKKTQ